MGGGGGGGGGGGSPVSEPEEGAGGNNSEDEYENAARLQLVDPATVEQVQDIDSFLTRLLSVPV